MRTEDAGIKRFEDKQILGWAAENDRLILTHDAKTFIGAAYERMGEGKSFSGLVVVPANLAIGSAIDELVILLVCALDDELHNTVIRLPL